MSCYEWENGVIKLPTKIFAKFRREFIAEYNAAMEECLSNVKRYREKALRLGEEPPFYTYKRRMEDMAKNSSEYDLIWKLFPDNRKKPLMPTRKMVNFVNGKDYQFDVAGGEGGIGFNKSNHSVSWSVYENNHAVDECRKSREAQAFFNMLSKVKWVRGTGGEIVGNNEYHRDDYSAGGGGNYVVQTFGINKNNHARGIQSYR